MFNYIMCIFTYFNYSTFTIYSRVIQIFISCRPFGYERVYLQFCNGADKPFHIQRGRCITHFVLLPFLPYQYYRLWSHVILTLSSLDLPLSSSSTTSRELLSQFSTCSGWRWFDMVEKLNKIVMYCWTSFMEILVLKPFVVKKLGLFSGM